MNIIIGLVIVISIVILIYFNSVKKVIIDVRTNDEYNKSHIPNAINIPHDNIDTLDLAKGTKIILYCNTGRRAKIARDTLTRLGYTNVTLGQ